MTQLALIGLLWRSALLLWQSDTFHATSSRRLPLNLITLIANVIMTLVPCRQVPNQFPARKCKSANFALSGTSAQATCVSAEEEAAGALRARKDARRLSSICIAAIAASSAGVMMKIARRYIETKRRPRMTAELPLQFTTNSTTASDGLLLLLLIVRRQRSLIPQRATRCALCVTSALWTLLPLRRDRCPNRLCP